MTHLPLHTAKSINSVLTTNNIDEMSRHMSTSDFLARMHHLQAPAQTQTQDFIPENAPLCKDPQQCKRLESKLAGHACKSPHSTPTPTDKPPPAVQPPHVTTPHTLQTMPLHNHLTTRLKKPQPHRTRRPSPTPKPNDSLHPLTPMSATLNSLSHPIPTNLPHEPHPLSEPPPFQRHRHSITDLPAGRRLADHEQVSDSAKPQILCSPRGSFLSLNK